VGQTSESASLMESTQACVNSPTLNALRRHTDSHREPPSDGGPKSEVKMALDKAKHFQEIEGQGRQY